MKAPFVCCQHSAYRSVPADGMLICICVTCGHKWQIMLCPNGREFWE